MKISETSEEYEELAKKLYEDILLLDGVDNIDVKHNVQIKGRSGVDHQIDVFWEYKYAGVTHKVLIECKHYSHNVSLLHVRNLHGLITDIPNSSGVLVTTCGYQSGAKEYADYYGLGLKLIRAPKDSDWEGCIKVIDVKLALIGRNYINFKFEVDGRDQKTLDLATRKPELMNNVCSTDMIIRDSDEEACSLKDWIGRHIPIDMDDVGKTVDKSVVPPSSYFVLSSGEELKVGRITVTVEYWRTDQQLTFDSSLLVKAVLQDFSSGEVEHMHKESP